jgi:hypothetical protein
VLRQRVVDDAGARRQSTANKSVARSTRRDVDGVRPWHAACSAREADTGDQSEQRLIRSVVQRGVGDHSQAAGHESKHLHAWPVV